MTRPMLRRFTPRLWVASGLIVMLLAAIQGCADYGGGGYGYDEDYGVGFYEPYGYYYGGWDNGYRVGPWRGGHDHDHDRGDRGEHGDHRPMPSIPTRGPGGHSGGGRR